MTADVRYSHVIILGAGVSGIATAAQLQNKFGIHDVRIFERYREPGGVWHINNYPGCGVDIPSSLYSYSFEQRGDWTKAWIERDEILGYYQSVFFKYGLQNRTSFCTEAVACRWDETTCLWHVYTRKAVQPENDAKKDHESEPVSDDLSQYEHSVCRILVNAVDKRVILVGNGCSGAQIFERLSPQVKSLTQLGRSKHHYLPLPDILDSAPVVFLRRHFPNVVRCIVFLYLESTFRAFRLIKGKAQRAFSADESRRHIIKTAPAKYHDILIPDSQKLLVGCKRRVLDYGYVKALNRDNVDLKAANVATIKENSVVLDSGEELPADAIVLATGFSLDDTGGSLKFYGRDGRDLKQYMREEFREPTTYRSTMMANFPNLFMIMSGTNSTTGHSSVVFSAECQIEWMFRVAKDIIRDRSRPSEYELKFGGSDVSKDPRRKFPTVEPKREAQVKEMLWMQENMQQYVFSSKCGSWYEDKQAGSITALYAGTQIDFWRRSRFPVWNDMVYANLSDGRTSSTRTWSERWGDWLRLGDVGKPKTTMNRKMEGGRIIDPGH
ncbi:hypothetical protein A4X06_0g169 [Tilletia controversa]|uniref:Uncharacterized protein n=2 Tax=Tilletia TaxID=13289 RepID=A0A8X7N129_9BASI|nr:hypothetical protein CF336_g101 [Tilletia laevis]KAE8204963.1 hypothetical protein CF328_g772 [Tilletia controversa]KAE8208541.1 hypothetical protein CF335_g334 [Tilletia laevis]KAE8255930.1 hypothetical protein A4X06_0g169 [Tilletia controversa]KAE8265087.1 hypothetical protein A4X03_0g495 [Tilletia caries]